MIKATAKVAIGAALIIILLDLVADMANGVIDQIFIPMVETHPVIAIFGMGCITASYIVALVALLKAYFTMAWNKVIKKYIIQSEEKKRHEREKKTS